MDSFSLKRKKSEKGAAEFLSEEIEMEKWVKG